MTFNRTEQLIFIGPVRVYQNPHPKEAGAELLQAESLPVRPERHCLKQNNKTKDKTLHVQIERQSRLTGLKGQGKSTSTTLL